jgi:hypothetical protein
MTRHFGLTETKRLPFGRAVRIDEPRGVGGTTATGLSHRADTLAQSNVIQLPASRDLNPRDKANLAEASQPRPFIQAPLSFSRGKVVQAFLDALTVAFWITLCGLFGLAVACSFFAIGYLIFIGW